MATVADILPVCTIGHSTRTIPEFVALLARGKVALVADIRSIPRSRANPQYNFDTLPDALSVYGLGYVRIEELGGLRKRSREVPPETNAFWTNRSFDNYADYALSDTFARGLARLLALARERRVAIMCAEAVWWRCHRRIVADHLLAAGPPVFHLMDEERLEPARMTPAARVEKAGIVYPA